MPFLPGIAYLRWGFAKNDNPSTYKLNVIFLMMLFIDYVKMKAFPIAGITVFSAILMHCLFNPNN